MKATWTKVYSGPGYPIDPQRELERQWRDTSWLFCDPMTTQGVFTFQAELVAIIERSLYGISGIESYEEAFAE